MIDEQPERIEIDGSYFGGRIRQEDKRREARIAASDQSKIR